MKYSDDPEDPKKPESLKVDEPDGFYFMKDICRLLRVCRSTVYNMIKAGLFLKPLRGLYRRRLAWRKSDVHAWFRDPR